MDTWIVDLMWVLLNTSYSNSSTTHTTHLSVHKLSIPVDSCGLCSVDHLYICHRDSECVKFVYTYSRITLFTMDKFSQPSLMSSSKSSQESWWCYVMSCSVNSHHFLESSFSSSYVLFRITLSTFVMISSLYVKMSCAEEEPLVSGVLMVM